MGSTLRILDANFNRVGEALRTIEEYARFAVGSSAWARRCKEIRHALSETRNALDGALPEGDGLLAHRDIQGDAGVAVKTPAEGERKDEQAVLAAAFRRACEGLRVLSEYGKVENAELSAAFEKARYAVYALEPLMLADQQLRRRLQQAKLYVLVTANLCCVDPLTATREAVAGGADIIQMREKELEDLAFHERAEAMAQICRDAGVLLLINDRPHIAQLVDAAGIHSGQGDLPVHLSRRIVGHRRIVGRSTSAPEFAEQALRDGADYIGVGPVYETNTKKHRRAVGLTYVSWAAEWDGLPFFAIGSINRETIDGVLAAGARRVAICTAITKAKDIAAETAFYRALLDKQTASAARGLEE